MSNISKRLSIIRLILLSAVSIFSIIVLAINAHYISYELNDIFVETFDGPVKVTSPDAFSAFGLSVGIISVLAVPPTVFIGVYRKGAVVSMIICELCAFGLLSVLWLAAAAWTSNVYSPLAQGCSMSQGDITLQTLCTDMQVSIAFEWLSWIIIMAHVVTLLTLSIISASNGRPVWKCSVRDANFASSKVAPSSQTSIMTAAEQLQMKVQEDPFAPSQPMGSNLSYKYAEV